MYGDTYRSTPNSINTISLSTATALRCCRRHRCAATATSPAATAAAAAATAAAAAAAAAKEFSNGEAFGDQIVYNSV